MCWRGQNFEFSEQVKFKRERNFRKYLDKRRMFLMCILSSIYVISLPNTDSGILCTIIFFDFTTMRKKKIMEFNKKKNFCTISSTRVYLLIMLTILLYKMCVVSCVRCFCCLSAILLQLAIVLCCQR